MTQNRASDRPHANGSLDLSAVRVAALVLEWRQELATLRAGAIAGEVLLPGTREARDD